MIKFILILHLCSFVEQPNCFDKQYVAQFKDHYSCVKMGYVKAYESFSTLEIKEINKNKLALKIECKEMEIS